MESWRRGHARFLLCSNPGLSLLPDIVCKEGDGVLITEGAGGTINLLSGASRLLPSSARRWLSFCFFLRGDSATAFLVTTEVALESVLEGAFVGDVPDVFSDLAEAAFSNRAGGAFLATTEDALESAIEGAFVGDIPDDLAEAAFSNRAGGAFLVTTEDALESIFEGAFVEDIPDVISDLAEAA